LPDVIDYPDRQRYEMPLDGEVAIAVYRDADGARIISHTEVPARLRGKGIGGQLVKGVLDDIRAKGMRVVPRCPFVGRYILSHPEYRELLAP
jgi:uncharacterized protein